MAASTIISARSALSLSFRVRIRECPLHQATNQKEYLGEIVKLFKAFERISPPTEQQKAISPRFLKCLGYMGSDIIQNLARDHVIDLIIGRYFFACRICEIAKTPQPGRTRKCQLRCVIFQDRCKNLIPHGRRILGAYYVTLLFEDQKNGELMERRTQRRTGDKSLCPVLRFGRAVLRVRIFVKDADKDTYLCALSSPEIRTDAISSEFTLKLLQRCCRIGGKKEFGFNKTDVGNRSIRSRAAMALFLTKQHPTKIMILGRWKSLAFLKYIQAQTLEWTDNLAECMISFEHFTDLCLKPSTEPNQDILAQHNESNWEDQLLPRLLLDF